MELSNLIQNSTFSSSTLNLSTVLLDTLTDQAAIDTEVNIMLTFNQYHERNTFTGLYYVFCD